MFTVSRVLPISLAAMILAGTLSTAWPATVADAQRTTPHIAPERPSAPARTATDDRPQIQASAAYTLYLPIVTKKWWPDPAGWLGINDFLYQLQNLDLKAVGNTAFDLVVMDYSADGSNETAYTPADVAALQNSPGGPKRLLAYLSIGEAEDYRYYWQSSWTPGNPAWLDTENPNWPGNYKVHYWDPEWQAVIFDYLDKIVAAGFDGAYLDLIDAYEYYEEQGRTTARQEMVDFVLALAAHARATDPDFGIFPQNTGPLLTEFPAYLSAITGVGQESPYYGYDADDQPTPPAATAEMESYLDVARAAGKLALTVDYASTLSHVDDAYARSQANGYVPYVTVRDLSELIIHPGHEPD